MTDKGRKPSASGGPRPSVRPDAGFRDRLAGLLSEHDLGTVVQYAQRHDFSTIDAVIALGFLNEIKAYASYAEWMGRPYVDLQADPPSATAARLVPEKVAKSRQILPIAHDNRTLTYASASVFNDEVDRDVSFASGRRARMVVVRRSQLMEALNASYRIANDIDKLIDRIQLDDRLKPTEHAYRNEQDSPIIELCNRIVASAITAGASDIHIEPSSSGAVVRHRISGVLEHLLNLPEGAVGGVTNRFKLMAKCDISTRFKPQDGAFRVNVDRQTVDVRLSALPTIHGEKIVMRVIQGGSSLLGIDTLGYDSKAEQALITALSKPDGLVLVTGPTGSGKTTVLYAALRFLQTGRVNIVTIEDPVERQVEGVTQIAVNSKSGTTFANVIRSVMRQDPNIIMVGEIRDNEVAEIVGQAAYTGHLVLSSLHTTDAASAITRLVNLGLQPHKIAESLNAVVAQRLVRKLCTHCAIIHDDATGRSLGARYGLSRVGASVGRGCDRCKQTGYADRIAVPEILVPDESLRTAIRNGTGVAEIRAAMLASGSASMRDTALALVARGITSIEEVNRVLTDHGDDGSSTSAASVSTPEPIVASAPAPPKPPPPRAPVTETRAIRRVLVIDDDRMIRLLVRMLLEKEGFKVLEAENGAVGMEMARLHKPELMLVDLQMPDLDGFQVLQMIRDDASLAAIPVLVLTSDSGAEVEAKVLEMGADDYLVKPFEPEVMLSRIRAAFRRAARNTA